jgi:hypothetical protein
MSVYKTHVNLNKVNSNNHLIVLHAKSINDSFESLGHNIHTSSACGACQLNGKGFRKAVFNLLSTEVRNYVSQRNG